jgi:hypothetical protein
LKWALAEMPSTVRDAADPDAFELVMNAAMLFGKVTGRPFERRKGQTPSPYVFVERLYELAWTAKEPSRRKLPAGSMDQLWNRVATRLKHSATASKIPKQN